LFFQPVQEIKPEMNSEDEEKENDNAILAEMKNNLVTACKVRVVQFLPNKSYRKS
jgi:hypothetical protein